MCPMCADDEDVSVVRGVAPDRQVVRHRCGYEWEHVTASSERFSTSTRRSYDQLATRFPTAVDVPAEWMERANDLKVDYLRSEPDFDPGVAEYWAKYQEVFSKDGLWSCDPQVLKDFANSNTGAHPGNQSVFNAAWNEMGTPAAAESTRRTIDYLLRGPADVPLGDRLEELIAGTKPFSMTGFKESLLTRALCVVHPARFLSILQYTTEAGGKREIARAVFGLELPAPERVNWTRGRLVLWSNDLLRELVGEGFANQQHSAAFLWWAKDQPGGPA